MIDENGHSALEPFNKNVVHTSAHTSPLGKDNQPQKPSKRETRLSDVQNGLSPPPATVQEQLDFLTSSLSQAKRELLKERYESETLRRTINVTGVDSVPLTPRTPTEFLADVHDGTPLATANNGRYVAELVAQLKLANERSERLRQQYEKQLSALRAQQESVIAKNRKSILTNVDNVVSSYRKLAQDTLHMAKKERAKVLTEREKCRNLTEESCKNFEAQIKQRVAKALKDCRDAAKTAHDAAQKERKALEDKCALLQDAAEAERQEFESSVVKESEERIAAHKKTSKKLSSDIASMHTNFKNLIKEMTDRIDLECRQLERSTLAKTLKILWDKGLTIDEEELEKLLNTTEEAPLRRLAPTLNPPPR